MKVTVTPRVVAGTDRGGEDLFLDFVAYHDGDTPPVEESVEEVQLGLEEWDGLTEVLDEETCDGGPEVCYRTCHYEFEWTGTGKGALQAEFQSYNEDNQGAVRKVESVFRNPANWHYCHKPGEPPRLKCCWEHYVDGNAE